MTENNLFKVEDFTFSEKYIHSLLSKNGKHINVIFTKKSFNLFLLTRGKLVWKINKFESFKKDELSGTMTIEEYWSESGMPYILDDIYEYLSSYCTKLCIENIICENPLKSILGYFIKIS